MPETSDARKATRAVTREGRRATIGKEDGRLTHSMPLSAALSPFCGFRSLPSGSTPTQSGLFPNPLSHPG